MINYKKNRVRFKPNELGSLYLDMNKINDNERPVIYIGGQLEHRFHVIEGSGYTFDCGHDMFSGSWFYEYPLNYANKKDINAMNFSKNLLAALKEANIGDVDIVTDSHGGMIASYASKSDLVHQVIAIHPPCLGTPLARPRDFDKIDKLLTSYEKLLLRIIKKIVNRDYGFNDDNYKGLDFSKIDFNKVLILSSSIDRLREKNKLVISFYDMIYKLTGKESDGVVIFDEDILNRIGVNYEKDDVGTSHLDAGSREYLERVITRKLVK